VPLKQNLKKTVQLFTNVLQHYTVDYYILWYVVELCWLFLHITSSKYANGFINNFCSFLWKPLLHIRYCYFFHHSKKHIHSHHSNLPRKSLLSEASITTFITNIFVLSCLCTCSRPLLIIKSSSNQKKEMNLELQQGAYAHNCGFKNNVRNSVCYRLTMSQPSLREPHTVLKVTVKYFVINFI
jgi:hypothetical protein